MNKYWLWGLLVPLLLVACDNGTEVPLPMSNAPTFGTQNLLENGSFEVGVANASGSGFASDSVPQNWEALTGPTYETRWVKDTALDGANSISFTSNWVDPAALAYVSQTLAIPESGKRFRLLVRIRMEGVDGEGMGIEIQGNNDEQNFDPEYVLAFENTPIVGSRGWTEYILTTDPLDEALTSLSIFLQMKRSTTGRAYIDQVELLMEE